MPTDYSVDDVLHIESGAASGSAPNSTKLGQTIPCYKGHVTGAAQLQQDSAYIDSRRPTATRASS